MQHCPVKDIEVYITQNQIGSGYLENQSAMIPGMIECSDNDSLCTGNDECLLQKYEKILKSLPK